ncbi:MAG: FtsL-like putative cell division protein [Rikenellaceae bacterium]
MKGINFNTNFMPKGFGSKRYTSLMISVAYITLLVIIYIFNIFSNQKIHKDIIKAQKDVEALTIKSTIIHSNYAIFTKESNILEELKRRNVELLESQSPPRTFKREL